MLVKCSALFMALVAPIVTSADDKAQTLELQTGLIINGLQFKASSTSVVYSVQITGTISPDRICKGKLHLDSNKPRITEFGYADLVATQPIETFDCTFKFIKRGIVKIAESRRVAAPLIDQSWAIYEIQSPALKTKVTLAMLEGERWPNGRLLVHDDKGLIHQMIRIADPGPHEPCHPGCFPAGTRINTPDGTRLIESLKTGDRVTTLSETLTASESRISSVFITKNRLIELQTEKGTLTTTETQPVCLENGKLRAAGELVIGDVITTWIDGRKQTAKIIGLEATTRTETVYNLVLGDPTLFIANGYVVRSKPPADVR